MAEYEDGRLHDTGDVVGDLEVTAVSFQTDENGRNYNFSYTFKPKDEMDSIRKAEKEHQAELARQEQAAAEQAKREAEEEASHRNEE